MSISDFIKCRLGAFLYSFCSIALILLFLFIADIRNDVFVFLLTTSIFGFVTFWTCDYIYTRIKYSRIKSCMDKLDKKYLIADIMPKGLNYEDKFYRELIRRACKSMLDEISVTEAEKNEYEEYIANWVHEAKTQITAIQLMCENDDEDAAEKILIETKKLEINVERIMYFSKSGETWKDYVIARTSLRNIVQQAIMSICQLLIINHVSIENTLSDEEVCNDPKWSSFIIVQILLNCIKYKKNDTITVKIYSERAKDQTKLIIEDNGAGIKENEIGKIFEKGYVGTNGRTTAKSSGMGLYLCKKLCDKLGIGISVQSKYGNYTRFILTYGEGSFCIT